MKNKIKQIIKEAKKISKKAKGSHDWDHTMRVCNLCLKIGEKENADLEVLEIAAILHDIGRIKQDKCKGKVCHAEAGGIMSRELLEKYELEKDKFENIIHCIETHRFRGNKIPLTKEAKILFDSDKLDSIGAIGIGRAFSFSGEIGAKVHNKDLDLEKSKEYSKEDTAYREFHVKLKKIKDRMLTEEGKKVAQTRHDFMEFFFERLNKEVDGEI
ncbi:MAG: HD domain-containing protein [Candidatus Gracilibacteria bacterium]|nr:HD domain-containing protein [Candidatus Gracilibacteria bacterium]